ncbi:MAG: hypothetical protein M1331_03190 [Candidatus Marsarchaeota archaeon]|nr:hypothetical protein [Candidatus Marsarchaeota archaeon]MCL5106371.1 hypothetical protein [Candidatus Marsarchaeota archaeon]
MFRKNNQKQNSNKSASRLLSENVLRNAFKTAAEYEEYRAGLDCYSTALAIKSAKANQYNAAEHYLDEAGMHFENSGHIQMAKQMFLLSGNIEEAKRIGEIQKQEIKKFLRKGA